MTMQPCEAAMPTTKTREIVDWVIGQIDAGILRPGDRLPSAEELRKQFACSLMPVKQATAELKLRGYVRGVVGVGVYVAARPNA